MATIFHELKKTAFAVFYLSDFRGRHQPSVLIVSLIKIEAYQDGCLSVAQIVSVGVFLLSRGYAPLDPHNFLKKIE